MLLGNGIFHLVSQDKSIQTLHIHQFAAITVKMGKNFVISDAVVGKETKRIRIVLEVLRRSSEQVISVRFM